MDNVPFLHVAFSHFWVWNVELNVAGWTSMDVHMDANFHTRKQVYYIENWNWWMRNSNDIQSQSHNYEKNNIKTWNDEIKSYDKHFDFLCHSLS